MFRPIPWLWDLVPSLDIRATKKSFTITFGNNKLLQTESPTIVRLGHLSFAIRDFLSTTLRNARMQRALLKRSYQKHQGQIITITPTAWWILLSITVVFYPLAFASIAMVFWLLATWLVLYVTYEAAQIIARVTRRLLDGPVQTFVSVIWNLSRGAQPLPVADAPGERSVPPRILLNIQPSTPEGGLQSPPRYEQTSPSRCEQPIQPWFEPPNPPRSRPPSYSGPLVSESAEDMVIKHKHRPRQTSIHPLPKARRRAIKAIMSRRVLEGN
ncbi:uncharacterized protein B0H64DRAFT_208977 [Chaetomium fimeti]|jgi:hypothetical protein|uniref:Uncharacterized protein n=1 Tax=Chaetomium fimeti TaxID=1854472 RepID=A0AAE0HAZ4_9PEZI|nr:hypothetical protein B0H64DRAFT_208977 [Chaetomium fimeti]